MVDNTKLVLMVQPVGRQGLIWQTILRSQGISVIWESADVNIPTSITYLQSAGAALPDLLLIDTRVQPINPYGICRWCHKHCPEVKVVLVNGAQEQVTPSEQGWALCQGAADLLPRFRDDQMASSAYERAKRILDLLGQSSLDSGALVTALMRTSKHHSSKKNVENRISIDLNYAIATSGDR
jgi:hypothetical protein